VLPNPWDVGGIRRLEKFGFKALASTSAGAAWSLGRNDGELSLDEVLAHLRLLCAARDLPLNADFEAAFADSPEGVERRTCHRGKGHRGKTIRRSKSWR
jgi:2-methylisocitrate lyase-like PEP mutase family enzyme